MSDKNGSNLNSSGQSITVWDLISILNHILPSQPSYVDKWNVISKGKVNAGSLLTYSEIR